MTMLSDDLRNAAHAARLCIDAPAGDLRQTFAAFGNLLDRAADEVKIIERKPAPESWRKQTSDALLRVLQLVIRTGHAALRVSL
jgi:hypothetical protein